MRLILFSFLLFFNSCFAQIVSIPIPGTPNLFVNVGVGQNALPLQDIRKNPSAVNVTMDDDSNVKVPLDFTFPYFGQKFTTSWMHSNGVVSFQSPNITGSFCCSGEDLSKTKNASYNYSIMPLWTDLIALNGGSHYYLKGTNELTYGWYNVSEYRDSNSKNSFEVKINSKGLIDTRLSGTMISYHPVTSGMTGNLANGEYFQFFHNNGYISEKSSSWNVSATDINGLCLSNPLYSQTCPDYASEYAKQQLLNSTQTVQTTIPVVATLSETQTSTTSPISVTSVTSVITSSPSTSVVQPIIVQEQKQENKKTETVETKSVEKKDVGEKGKQSIKESNNAKTMEAQIQTQSSIISFMGYVPGFGAYENVTLRDFNQLEMNKKYSKDSVDNRTLLRRLGGSNESRWHEIVDSQYKSQQ